MRDLAHSELDRIDRLRVGQGMLEAFAFGRGDLLSGMVGGGVEYGHRLSKSVSLVGQGEAGYQFGDTTGAAWKALLGLRWTQN